MKLKNNQNTLTFFKESTLELLSYESSVHNKPYQSDI